MALLESEDYQVLIEEYAESEAVLYIHDQILRVTITDEPVDSYNGTMQIMLTSMDIYTDDAASAEMAVGAPTPKGNQETTTRAYFVHNFGWAEPINHLRKRRLGALLRTGSPLDLLVQKTRHQVLGAWNKRIAEVLRGDGTAARGNDAVVQTLLAAQMFDNTSSSPISIIDDGLKALRGTGQIRAIMGYDVALALSVHPQITGADAGSGKNYVDFGRVRAELAARGVTDVVIDGGVHSTTDRWMPEARGGIYDGVFCLTAADNLGQVVGEEVESDEWYDDDTRVDHVRTYGAKGVMTKDPERTLTYKNVVAAA